MTRNDFGQLIATLRKEHFDYEGNRLTQAGLSDRIRNINPRTSLNEIVLGKIERGERANLEYETLLNLAEALQLTVGERREFILAAAGLEEERLYALAETAPDFLASSLHTLSDIQLPALLVDRYLDVIAVNTLALTMYDIRIADLLKRRAEPTGLNLLSYIFSTEFHAQRDRMSESEWRKFALGNLIYFRRMTLRFRMTDYFHTLLIHLQRSREFRWYWEQVFDAEKLFFVGGESFQMGTLGATHRNYLTTPIVTLTPYGNLEIVTHIPRDQETAAAFHQMAMAEPPSLHRLASWPEKKQRLEEMNTR